MIQIYFFSESCYEKVFQVANEELTSIDNWLTANKLSLNINKTNYIVKDNYIVFRTPNRNSKLPSQHALQLRNREIERVVSVKVLGVIVQGGRKVPGHSIFNILMLLNIMAEKSQDTLFLIF